MLDMRDVSKHPATVILPLVISVVALGLAIASFAQSCGVESEERAIEVHVQASISQPTPPQENDARVTVAFANESLRSIILRNASLWLGDQQLAVGATAYSAPEAGAKRSPFPLTLEAREGRSIHVFVAARLAMPLAQCLASGPDSYDDLSDAERQRCRVWRAALVPERSRRRLELRLELVPGGIRPYPVRLEPLSHRPIARDVAETAWGVGLDSTRPPGSLSLGHSGEGPLAGIVRLDLWRIGDPQFHRSFKRPLTEGGSWRGAGSRPHDEFESVFPLPELERGLYEYAFRVEGQTVETGCIGFPTTKLPGGLSCD